MMQYRLGYQILSMLMSIFIPRYHNQLNNIDFFKLAAVGEWKKQLSSVHEAEGSRTCQG